MFQTDEGGRVLFFTAPPAYVENGAPKPLHLFQNGQSEQGDKSSRIAVDGVKTDDDQEDETIEVRPSSSSSLSQNTTTATTFGRAQHIGHSARYLAAKIRRRDELESKRAAYEREREASRQLKRKRDELDAREANAHLDRLKRVALARLNEALAADVRSDFKALYGDERWRDETGRTVDALAAVEEGAKARAKEVERYAREKVESRRISLRAGPGGVFDEV